MQCNEAFGRASAFVIIRRYYQGIGVNGVRTIHGREWGALALILALALGLRLFKADAPLWYDEIFTLINFVRLPTADLIASYDSLNNHMLYSLGAQAAIAVLGENPLALRLPAILLGVGSIFVQWRISRRFTGAVPSLIVALLLAVSYHHVWFSQNARGYTGLLFFTSWATLLFIKGLERPGWKIWTGYGLLVAAAMYMHMSAGFFFVAHGVVYAGMLTARWVRQDGAGATGPGWPGLTTLGPVYGIGLSVVVTLALYAPIIGQAAQTIGEVSQASSSAKGAALAEWRNPLRAVQEIGASISSAGPLVPVILVGAVLVLAVGVVALYRRAPLLTAIYVLHVPLAMIVLYFAGVRIWPRYFFVDIGFIMMALVEGVIGWSAIVAPRLSFRGRPIADARWYVHLGFVIMLLVSVRLLVPNYLHPKQDFTAARDLVRRFAAPTDSIAAVGLAAYAYREYYAPEFLTVETGEDLARLRQETRGATWLIMAFPHQTMKARPDVADELAAHFDEMDDFSGTLGDGGVWTYRSKDAE